MTKIFDFAIVGAGIAGLASAIALAKAGHGATVYEQAAEIDEVGAGLQIGPNAAHALRQLGIWDSFEPDTVAPDAIVIRAGNTGNRLARIDLTHDFEDRFGAPYRVAHRAQLIAGLKQAALANPSIQIRTGCHVETVTPDDAGASLQLADGETARADAVIAADGVRSNIRQAMLGDGPPDYTGHAIYRALLPMIDVPAATDRTSVNLWLYPGGHVVHYPVNAGRQLNIVAAADSLWVEDDWKAQAEPAEVTGHFAEAAPALKELLAAPRQWHKWAGADRPPASTWNQGNVSLIGDAAHPSLPYLAQGAAMALEDAVVLGQCFAGVAEIADAFERFQQLRLARTAKLVSTSRSLGRIYHLKSASGTLRNLAISTLPDDLSIRRLSWLYAWKALEETT